MSGLKWIGLNCLHTDNNNKSGALRADQRWTRFKSLELKIGSLESEKIIIGFQESEKIGSLESEKSGP